MDKRNLVLTHRGPARLRLGFATARGAMQNAHQIARRVFIDQYGAFDIVAKTPPEKTHRLAS